MDKDKILDYVMTSPANTNPNVLKTMLDDSGSEMNPGYSCTETVTLLTDESVTTSKPKDFPLEIYNGMLSIEGINAPSIRVTFNGTSYNCKRVDGLYGAPGVFDSKDWSQYPFSISGDGTFQTESAGTYSIKIETVEEVVETTPCFEKAVNSVVGGGSGGGGGAKPLIVKLNGDTLDKTWQEIYDAFPNVVFDGGNAEGGMYQQNAIKSVGGFGKQYLVIVNDANDVGYKATSTSGYPKADLN